MKAVVVEPGSTHTESITVPGSTAGTSTENESTGATRTKAVVVEPGSTHTESITVPGSTADTVD